MSDYDTDYTDFPVCPYCGTEDQDWWDGLPAKRDGSVWEIHCFRCAKHYMIEMRVETTFSTRVIEKENRP